jgi:CBS domain-containing protein
MDNEEIRRDADVADQRPPGCTLTPATLVHVAHAHLRNSGEPAAVVFRNGRPVGVVTEWALTRARTGNRADAPLATVMDYMTIPVASGVARN